jgi:hypothetical protein
MINLYNTNSIMQRRWSINKITCVEAVYLSIIKRPLHPDVENGLIQHMYNKDIYMWIYLCWLLERWHPLYARYPDDLPKNIPSKSNTIMLLTCEKNTTYVKKHKHELYWVALIYWLAWVELSCVEWPWYIDLHELHWVEVVAVE